MTPVEYCCTITGSNGCTASNCATVTGNVAVIALLTSFDGDPCSNGEQTLVANAGGGTEPYFYFWSTGSTGASTTIPSWFSGPVSLTVTDGNNCNAQSSITVTSALTVFALATKASSGLAADGSIDLLVSGGQAPIAYLWSNGSTSEDVSSLTSGTYTVTVTGANGCSTVLTVPLITVDVQEINANLMVRILPNPVQNKLTVRLQNPDGAVVALRLKDLSGRLLSEQRGRTEVFFFDTAILSDGVYVLWVETSLGQGMFKVVVAR